jgi:hypothetical protein
VPCRLGRPGQDLSGGLLTAATEPVTERARVRELFGHIKPGKTQARFLEFCRYLRSLSTNNRPA